MLQFYDQAGAWAAEFVCDENDQRLFPPNYQIKLRSYDKICLFIIFPSVDCLSCYGGRHFEYDVSRELFVTYIDTPIVVQSLILLFVHILYFKPLIDFLTKETWFFYHLITQNIV